jgi:hypothetical protein
LDQGFAGGEAGAAEVLRDFHMGVGGMEKRGGAVEEGDEGQSEGSVLIRLAAELRGEAALQEFERRHVLLVGESCCPVLGDEAVVVGMGHKEIENAAASLHRGARRLDGGEEIEAGAAAEQGEEVLLAAEALVEGRRGGVRSAGDGAHGERMFAASAPQMVSGGEDAAFQTGISFAGHAALSASYEMDYILYSVKETMYK